MPREIARRSLLAGISAMPAVPAAALPLPVLAHPVAPQADADLIAAARRVSTWARLETEAEIQLAEAEDRRDIGAPENGHADAQRPVTVDRGSLGE